MYLFSCRNGTLLELLWKERRSTNTRREENKETTAYSGLKKPLNNYEVSLTKDASETNDDETKSNG